MKKKERDTFEELFQSKLMHLEVDTERDHFMSAQEAKEYGLVDEVIVSH